MKVRALSWLVQLGGYCHRSYYPLINLANLSASCRYLCWGFAFRATRSGNSTEDKLVPKPAVVVWFLFAEEAPTDGLTDVHHGA